MADYRLLPFGAVIPGVGAVMRTRDNQMIPFDPTNADYSAFLVWAALPGNTADPVAEPETPLAGTTLSSLQLIERLTDAEQLAVVGAAIQTPAIMLWLIKCVGADYIDVRAPLTTAGIDFLIAQNLLDPARKAAILALPSP